MRITLLGPQGSGKGTQGKMLAKKLGVPHVSTGELLRDIAAEDSELGRKMKAIMDEGLLVSDEQLLEVLGKRFEKPDCQTGWVLDGTPRNFEQAEILEDFAPVDKAVLIDITEEEAFSRIMKRHELEGRSDDTPESLRKRLDVYKTKTLPVIDFYDGKGKLLRIDGMQCIECVFSDLCKELDI